MIINDPVHSGMIDQQMTRRFKDDEKIGSLEERIESLESEIKKLNEGIERQQRYYIR